MAPGHMSSWQSMPLSAEAASRASSIAERVRNNCKDDASCANAPQTP